MDIKDQESINREHVANPREGDFWHEMFCPYYLIVAVDNKGVLVLHNTVGVDNGHYRFDEDEIKYMTKLELRDSVTYETMRDKFVANVRPGK